MSRFYQDAVFWIEVDKIKPNPFQPRRDFDESMLKSLADSIRQYGVLQALVVTRKEVEKPEERRLRAARLAGLAQVPALIRTGEESDLMKLELAIIENIQREDLSPVDRAHAFERLAKEFNFTHQEIGKKVGKSREYVSNTLRILMLPEHILTALSEGKISEGHTRPLMMLIDRREEQETLFKEIIFKKLNVREAENIARHIAVERARKLVDHELIDIEDKFKEKLGTRVRIEKREDGGRLLIDFFNKDDLRALLDRIVAEESVEALLPQNVPVLTDPRYAEGFGEASEDKIMVEDSPVSSEDDETLYSVSNFSI